MSEEFSVYPANEWLEPVSIANAEEKYRRFKQQQAARLFDRELTEGLLDQLSYDVAGHLLHTEQSLIAVGYLYEASGYVNTLQPTVIAAERAVLRPLRMQEIAGIDQPVFGCEVLDSFQESDMVPSVIPLFGLLWTQKTPQATHNAIEGYIANSRIFAERLLADTALRFYSQPAAEQHRLLYEKVTKELLADITVEYDDSVTIRLACDEAYMQGDAGAFTSCGARTLEGVVRGATYLESCVSHLPQLRHVRDFISRPPLPTLHVVCRDGAEYFVPIGAITHFSDIDEGHY